MTPAPKGSHPSGQVLSINKVDWSRLRQATGTCEHIPEALDQLCSSDSGEIEAAHWKIDNHVVLQGDLYEAAPFVVVGLLGCLDKNPVHKEEIYDLLVELANGYAPDSDRVEIDGEHVPVKAATTKALASGIAHYRRDLGGQSTATRKHIAELLLTLSDLSDFAPGELHTFLKAESDEGVRDLLEELIRELERRN